MDCVYFLPGTNHPIEFTNIFDTTPEGLLAIGGNLLPETLVNAYAKGIFPWYSEGDPILWWHPEPRMVIFPDKIHISKRIGRLNNKTCLEIKPYQRLCDGVTGRLCAQSPLRQVAKSPKSPNYTITINQDFKAVIEECSRKRSKNRQNTWITPTMQRAYSQLHESGYAHSVEVWNQTGNLVGGMYGVALGKIFFGESMFSHAPNTSKLALFRLCEFLHKNGFLLLDCQVASEHLKTLGAVTISRQEFMDWLEQGKTYLKEPSGEFKIQD